MNWKTLGVLMILFLMICSGRLVSAEQDKTVETEAQILKERQQFNKLKRTTQNIYKLTMRPSVVFRLQTALGYVSTIDLPEKALKVFVGDQELFKVGVYEKQVLIKPITDEKDARTNVVIVTGSSRLAFDVSVGPPESADFVLDFRFPQDDELLVQNAFEKKVEEKSQELEKTYKEKEKQLDQKAEKLSEEKLKQKIVSEVKNIPLKVSAAKNNVQVNLLSLAQVGDKSYLRFSVLNYSKTPYRVAKVLVGAISLERKFLRKHQEGVIEFPSELTLPEVIKPDSYEYGVLVFDYRVLGKNQKSMFRILQDAGENTNGNQTAETLEIQGFAWFK